jgi:serine/threonine protein kinase
MELIVSLLGAFSTAKDVLEVSTTVMDWVVEKINTWSKATPSKKIDDQLDKIARVTEAEIRGAADKAFTGKKIAISAEQREELIGILINMTRNVRARNSYGVMRSSFLRSERLLDQLLSDVEPARRWGEPVTSGNPWTLQRYLGMGSFGEVWMARNPHYPIPKAYKFFTRPEFREWLRREQKTLVEVLKRLGDHENIVKFLGVQMDGCDFPYLELEYLGGGSLEEWILEEEGLRPAIDRHEIVRQVVTGLAAAHEHQISHRDLKPANILLSEGPDAQIKIADFGLAKISGPPRAGASALASLAGMVGTSLYLPPEAQLRGVRRSPFQDDVFAVGVIWYQLLVGAIERPPYDFAARLRAEGIDPATIEMIERCLAHPDRRYPNAVALEFDLNDITDIPPIQSPIPGVPDVQHLVREYLFSLS